MAFRQPALVSRQFNSPIRLYSQENVAETLNKQAHILANGALGIDFHQLSAPSNLANSAVLRMLEEEERGGKSLKRVAWPPPLEDQEIVESQLIYSKGPAFSDQFGPAPIQAAQPSYPAHSAPSAQPPQSYKPSKVASPPLLAYQPPPATITLRAEPPIHQEQAPVFTSQPAATKGLGSNMRGDEKWPPATVKAQSAAENEARKALAKGPAFRPRKVKKDYSNFFAQNALNPNYPGYRAPPGTQHYTEEGTSDL